MYFYGGLLHKNHYKHTQYINTQRYFPELAVLSLSSWMNKDIFYLQQLNVALVQAASQFHLF